MIKINNLKFSYPHHAVLDGISMTLTEGNVYGLLGENGVGKTTLLKLLAGLLKPSDGQILIEGQTPYKRSPFFLQDMFFVPEDFYAAEKSIKAFFDGKRKFYPKADIEKFNQLMNEFDVNPKWNISKISQGERKKAMIASSLALNTSIVLMDEPSNGLDIPSKSLLRKVVAQNAAEDKLFIISTHQVRDLENIIDPIIIMDNKQVLLNASIEQITDKLYFTTRETKIENTLYSEFTPNGYTSVELNKDGLQSKVNLESLFNATMAYRDIFKTMFNN